MRIVKPYADYMVELDGDIITVFMNCTFDLEYFGSVFKVDLDKDTVKSIDDRSMELNPIFFDKWAVSPPLGMGFLNPLTGEDEPLRELTGDELAALSIKWERPVASWRDLIPSIDKNRIMNAIFNPRDEIMADPLLKPFGISLRDLRRDPKAALTKGLRFWGASSATSCPSDVGSLPA